MKLLSVTLCALSLILPISPPIHAQTHPAHAIPDVLPPLAEFGPGRYILSSGMPMLTDNSYSAPMVCDWNGDGMKDLMVGVFFDGNIHLFLNQGTNDNPVYGEGTLLSADGSPISVGYG